MFRGRERAATPVIAPKFVLAMEALGIPYCTWFKELNMSARTTSLCPSQGIENVFMRPRSSVFVPSMKNVLRPSMDVVLKSAVVSARKAERGSKLVELLG